MNNWKNPIILDYINYLGKEPIESLRKEALYLLKKTQQLYSENNFTAINIDIIANLLGLKDGTYKYNNFLESSARIIQESINTIRIELNKNKETFINYRHRFIIAHEIGHWVIRSKIKRRFSKDEILLIKKHKYEEELLCHYFASELIMPENIFSIKFNNKKLSGKLIRDLHYYFKVPDYQIINRILLLNKEYIGVYWKNKISKTSNIKKLRVLNFYPDNRIRQHPYIPIDATAKSERFNPNIILESYKTNKSLSNIILIKDFGDIKGYYETFVYNPNMNQNLFNEYNYNRKFDLITIFKKYTDDNNVYTALSNR